MSSFQRIFWFYNRLKENRHPTRQCYMEKFEVSESAFKRDLMFLRDRLGAPIEYDRDTNGYILTETAFEIPSFWFDRMQLMMLISLCQQLQKMEGVPPGSELSAFREKLRQLLILRDGDDLMDCLSFEHVEWTACDGNLLSLLMEALLQKRCVSFTYHAAGTDRISTRTVEPYRLHNYMGTWYLVGFCRLHGEPRVFQAARITGLEITAEAFGTPKFDVSAFLNASFGIFKGKDAFTVKLSFDPFISRFIRNEIWHDRQQLSDSPDGYLIMTLPVSDLTEIKMKVLKYGSHVEALEPESLRVEVAEEAKKIVEKYVS